MPGLLPYLELILLLISLVTKKTAGSSNCRASFSYKDHALVGHVMRTLKHKTFESCTFSCELEPQCFSVNYIASTKTCQLNNVSKEYFPGNMVELKGAIYIDMVIREYRSCVSMRCENGGTCVTSPSVMCKCLKGFSGLRCESIQLQALGMESGTIPDKSIEASTTKAGYAASGARLNTNSCWMPAQDKSTEYIKVTFTSTKNITAMATQGAPNDDCWVTNFKLQWFNDDVLETHQKVYQANVDNNSVVTNTLTTPLIRATFIRIYPQSWHSCIAMRLEFYGYWG